MASLNCVGVIGAPSLAAGLKPLGVTVVGGTGGGFMLDVQQVRRGRKVDGIVVGEAVVRWTPVMRWIWDQGVPVVVASPVEAPQTIVERVSAGGDDRVEAGASPEPAPQESDVGGAAWLPPSKQKAGNG